MEPEPEDSGDLSLWMRLEMRWDIANEEDLMESMESMKNRSFWRWWSEVYEGGEKFALLRVGHNLLEYIELALLERWKSRY